MSEQFSQNRAAEILTQNNLILRAICHDVANALSVIMMASQQLNLNIDKDPERAKKLLERIESAAEMQRQLIVKTKEIGWFLDTRDYPKTVSVDLHQAISKAVLLQSSAAEKKHIRIDIEVPAKEKGPFLVLADKAILIHFILSPLLENAIKFTPAYGKISLSFAEHDKCTHIRVADNGVGIEDIMAPYLFDIEMRSPTEGTEGERGFGLGLPLLMACVNRLKGKVSWSSVKSMQHSRLEGTEFTVVLPNFASLES